MKKLIVILVIASSAVFQSCEQCYTCTKNTNSNDIIDHCGRGKDLKSVVDAQEAGGYTCVKR